MKNVILLLLSVCGMLACTHTPKWELVWEDNFDGAEPDTTIWSRIPRGRPDWQNTQSFDNRCYEMRDGCLILKGIVNDNMDVDTAKYLTGGQFAVKITIPQNTSFAEGYLLFTTDRFSFSEKIAVQ